MITIAADDAHALVVATVAGPLTADVVASVVSATRSLAHERGFNILYDMREALPGEVAPADLFWMPRRLPQLKAPEARRVRTALVYPESFPALARFWETAFTNSGLLAKAFTSDEEARAWLRS